MNTEHFRRCPISMGRRWITSGASVILTKSASHNRNKLLSAFVENLGPSITTAVPVWCTWMPIFRAVSIIMALVAGQNGGSTGMCMTLSSFPNMVDSRCLVLNTCGEYYKTETHKTLKRARLTSRWKSLEWPGRQAGFVPSENRWPTMRWHAYIPDVSEPRCWHGSWRLSD